MASPSRFNSKSTTIKRILREASELTQYPSPDFHAAPATDADLFDWHFTLRGPPSSAFAHGIYHGRIVLPPTYPLRPPSFRFLNQSGRFEVNREICLSISGHHEETWMPAWGVRTALVALRSFMETDAKGQLGGLECSTAEREKFAKSSVGWVCSVCKKTNGDILRECEEAAIGRPLDISATMGEVPADLNLACRDKLEQNQRGRICENEEGLADGFFQKGPPNPPVAPSAHISATNPRARPGQSASQATDIQPRISGPSPPSTASISLSTSTCAPVSASVPVPASAPAPVYPQAQRARTSNNDVPMWIDRAIATILVCLLAMIMKVLLGM